MKKALLSAGITLLSFAAAHAQTTITASANMPVAGDVYVDHYLSADSVSIGASGASASWNYASLSSSSTDTTRFMTCAATPYCDSFSGTDLASADGGDYSYFYTSGNKLVSLGGYSDGDFIHFIKNMELMRFPLTYNDSYVDTAITPFSTMNLTYLDSNKVDAYGTLAIPSGTYNNVIRVHTISYHTLSMGTIPVSQSVSQSYKWYTPGFHSPLMLVDMDTAGTGTWHVTDAQYYTGPMYSTTAVNNPTAGKTAMKLFPNPATDNVHIAFSLNGQENATLIISDLTGRIVNSVSQLSAGANDINLNTADMAAGMYIAQLHTADGVTTQKFTVSK